MQSRSSLQSGAFKAPTGVVTGLGSVGLAAPLEPVTVAVLVPPLAVSQVNTVGAQTPGALSHARQVSEVMALQSEPQLFVEYFGSQSSPVSSTWLPHMTLAPPLLPPVPALAPPLPALVPPLPALAPPLPALAPPLPALVPPLPALVPPPLPPPPVAPPVQAAAGAGQAAAGGGGETPPQSQHTFKSVYRLFF